MVDDDIRIRCGCCNGSRWVLTHYPCQMCAGKGWIQMHEEGGDLCCYCNGTGADSKLEKCIVCAPHGP